jgi:hypothetical protein
MSERFVSMDDVGCAKLNLPLEVPKLERRKF